MKKELFKATIESIATLDLQLVSENYLTKKDDILIEALFLDRYHNLVIGVFRDTFNSHLLKGGIEGYDYIKQNLSEFKILLKEKGITALINAVPRIVVFSEYFNNSDIDSIKYLMIDTELVETKNEDNKIVFKKRFLNRKTIQNFTLVPKYIDTEIFKSVRSELMKTFDCVREIIENDKIVYINNKPFLEVTLGETSISLKIKSKKLVIKSVEELYNHFEMIYNAYENS